MDRLVGRGRRVFGCLGAWEVECWHRKKQEKPNQKRSWESAETAENQQNWEYRTQNTKMTISETKDQNRQKQGHEIESGLLAMLEMH